MKKTRFCSHVCQFCAMKHNCDHKWKNKSIQSTCRALTFCLRSLRCTFFVCVCKQYVCAFTFSYIFKFDLYQQRHHCTYRTIVPTPSPYHHNYTYILYKNAYESGRKCKQELRICLKVFHTYIFVVIVFSLLQSPVYILCRM